ncbi:MAG TPA: hypothetical protein VFL14_08355 [Xanthomonadales bacterium]|nr:hypothetical protein [Xanthomonadales bacterium]
MTNRPLRLLVLAAALALSACATKPREAVPSQDVAPPPPFPEDVSERAQERWQLLVAKNGKRAYDLLSPGVRSGMTREQYAGAVTHRPVTWLGAKVTGRKCDGDSCTVMVQLRYKAEIPQSSAGPIESVAYLEERWIRVDGEWFLVPEKTSAGELR